MIILITLLCVLFVGLLITIILVSSRREKFTLLNRDVLTPFVFQPSISLIARNRLLGLIRHKLREPKNSDILQLLRTYGYSSVVIFPRRQSASKLVWHHKLTITSSIQDYYSMIYPNASEPINIEGIEYLYSCAPNDLKALYEPLIDPNKLNDYRPVQLYASWRPIWYVENTYSLNLYPPNRWWDYENLNKYKSYQSIEASHVNDDNPYYAVYGLWTYITKGTGVFYNLGKTLQAMNKIHSLYLLGFSVHKIAQLLLDKHYFYNPNQQGIAVITTARKFPGADDFSKLVAMITYIIEVGQDYDIDRVNNTADLDGVIATRAKELGYDSVQFQVQANGYGGWAHECAFVGANPLLKVKEADWAGWTDMARVMTLEDPNHINCPKSCTPRLNAIVTCKEQDIPKKCVEMPDNPPNY